jgi:hypothetical protein
MEQTTLITGRYTEQLLQMAKTLNSDQTKVCLLVNINKGSLTFDEGELGFEIKTVEGNSPVSFRAALMDLIKIKNPKRFVVWYEPLYDQTAFHSFNALQLNKQIDQSVNLYSHVIKELIKITVNKTENEILFLENRIHDTVLTPFDALSAGAFRSLIDSLFAYYKNESIILSGVEIQGIENSEANQKLKDLLEEGLKKQRGKWNNLGSGSGLFSKARLFRPHN